MKGTFMLRPTGIVSMCALAAVITGTGTPIQGCKPAPQPSHAGAEAGGIAAVAGVAVAAVILVSIEKDHHNIKGCVIAGESGLELLNKKDGKTYKLLGATQGTMPGDIVRLHGSKEKEKNGSADDPSFVVQQVTRTYGPCKVAPAPAPTAANAPQAANNP
jgi:hypothetical protein